MNILITNDDGVYAIGVNVLKRKLIDLGHNVTVIAPDRNCSAASHSLTLRSGILFHWLAENIVAVQGTPVDCIYLAMNGLLDNKPDLVISGINHGENLGDDVLYSGTLAAATESVLAGIPAFAVSLVGSDNFITAAKVVDVLLSKKLWQNYNLWNINVPDIDFQALNGFLVTKQGLRNVQARVKLQLDSVRGDNCYWVQKPSDPLASFLEDKSYDFGAVNQNYVSLTPITIDHTEKDKFLELIAISI